MRRPPVSNVLAANRNAGRQALLCSREALNVAKALEDESEGRANLVEDREAHHNGVQGENRCPYPPSEHNAAAREEQKPKDPVRHI